VEPTLALIRHSQVAGRFIAGVVVVSAMLAGCASHRSDPGTSLALGPDPALDVVGLAGVEAVHRLQVSGYKIADVTGRWSRHPVGVILAERGGSGGGEQDAIRLVASMGPRATAGALVTLPGVATCDLGQHPSGADCRGGPVILWMRHSHRN
jgi:hypothetical protein